MLSERTRKKFLAFQQCSINGRKVQDLFKLAVNTPDLWEEAYYRRYANPGNMTKGTSDLTMDGYSEERAGNLRELLKENRYKPLSVRRVYIPKGNGKMRPLGIPDSNDKQVQEVWRMILETLYEPLDMRSSMPNGFLESSHGFRPQRSCHTALREIQREWTGTKWFLEFDIEGFFDNIDHKTLMQLLEKKIDDVKFLKVIKMMLQAGYMEDWKFHQSLSGTPQGGIISPILANIYLHELDIFVEQLTREFHKGVSRRMTPEYRSIKDRVFRINKRIKQETDPEKRTDLIAQKRVAQLQQWEIPSTDQYDPQYRRLRYCRYADDFLLGVIGPKSEALAIMERIKAFLHERLRLKYSETKTGLKHNSEVIRFLGYDITVINTEKIVRTIVKGQPTKRRVGKGHITLYVPEERLQKFSTERKYGNWETLKPVHRSLLTYLAPDQILLLYNTELRGLAEYYALANNFSKALWGKVFLLWKGSFLKTMASKYQTTVSKVRRKLDQGRYLAVIVPQKVVKGKTIEPREYRLFDPGMVDQSSERGEEVDRFPLIMQYMGTTELQKRREARVCESCEEKEGYFEVHHVRKLADLTGKTYEERLMIARRRKTIVLCIRCHHRLHKGTLPDRRQLRKE
jgi:group II intron reverse transcriptase/maturase